MPKANRINEKGKDNRLELHSRIAPKSWEIAEYFQNVNIR